MLRGDEQVDRLAQAATLERHPGLKFFTYGVTQYSEGLAPEEKAAVKKADDAWAAWMKGKREEYRGPQFASESDAAKAQ